MTGGETVLSLTLTGHNSEEIGKKLREEIIAFFGITPEELPNYWVDSHVHPYVTTMGGETELYEAEISAYVRVEL